MTPPPPASARASSDHATSVTAIPAPPRIHARERGPSGRRAAFAGSRGSVLVAIVAGRCVRYFLASTASAYDVLLNFLANVGKSTPFGANHSSCAIASVDTMPATSGT